MAGRATARTRAGHSGGHISTSLQIWSKRIHMRQKAVTAQWLLCVSLVDASYNTGTRKNLNLHPLQRKKRTGKVKDVDVIPLSPSVHGLLQSSSSPRTHPMQAERAVTRGREQRKRQSGTANGREGEVFPAQNALASAQRAGREEAGAETAAGAEEREGRAG